VPPDILGRLREVFDLWTEESRTHEGPYGETIDGRPRFDVEPGHSAGHPGLRRVASPTEVSEDYLAFMRYNIALDATTQVFGPNLRFRESKVNSKLPGTATHLKYHQDLPFGPLTNQDLITVLFLLDDVSDDNGPLEVVPGSHLGPLYDHWHDGVFTGAVSEEVAGWAKARSVTCVGLAGSAYLLNARLLHGSGPNLSTRPRTLFIVQYHAEDAYPLAPNHLPSIHDGEIVRGRSTNRVRCTEWSIDLPQKPTMASFFAQQADPAIGAG
jgi:phytanoyl-CoA hydroxylase